MKYWLLYLLVCNLCSICAQTMMYADCSRKGVPFAKDPSVIKFEDRFLMYYSLPPAMDNSKKWGIGIAVSENLVDWRKIGEINSDSSYTCEQVGICAPCAIMRNDTIHLFYQTYGMGKSDAICHAFSTDGVTFERNSTNPIFSPDGDWNCGRAIDAEVFLFNDNYYLYYATRDKSYQKQIIGVAVAGKHTNFNREEWADGVDAPVLIPELEWEGNCIEAPSIVEYEGMMYMFYAGNYNNCPQQIGVAVSQDGLHWKKCFKEPFLRCGEVYSWNSSESGHPCIFTDKGEYTLFYQGNNDNGKTWWLSSRDVIWKNKYPVLK